MQIYSKHKDYYDGQLIQISSLDRFIRHEDNREKVVPSKLPDGLIDLPLDSRLQYLFFCGSVYPFICNDRYKEVKMAHPTRYDYKGKPVYEQFNISPSFLWSFDDIKEYLEKTDQLSFCFRETLAESFAINDTKKLHNIQLASNTCYFVFKPAYSYKYRNSEAAGDLIFYPSLKDIQAYKILDPYTVAQQIDYWLGNILVNDTIIQPTEDKYKILAKGHDPIVSFRTESGAKRRKDKNASNK